MEDKNNMGYTEKPDKVSWNHDQIEYQQSDFMQGMTDFANDQYHKPQFPITDKNYKYPERTDSTNKDYYGRKKSDC